METEQGRQEKNNVAPFRLEDYGYETKTPKASAITPFNFQEYYKQREQSKEENPSSLQLNAKGEDCDSFRFLIDNELKMLYGIALHFKIDFDKMKLLNSHIKDYSKMQKGDTIYLPKGTLLVPKNAPKEYDSFKFMVDNDLANLYRVAVHYKLDYNKLIEINSHIDDLNSMQEGLVITNHHHSGKKQIGEFERKVSGMKDGDTKSFVILAHDTVSKHVNEILEDKLQMEKHASKNGVKIEYMNMSTLFKKVTNEDVDKFSPNY